MFRGLAFCVFEREPIEGDSIMVGKMRAIFTQDVKK